MSIDIKELTRVVKEAMTTRFIEDDDRVDIIVSVIEQAFDKKTEEIEFLERLAKRKDEAIMRHIDDNKKLYYRVSDLERSIKPTKDRLSKAKEKLKESEFELESCRLENEVLKKKVELLEHKLSGRV